MKAFKIIFTITFLVATYLVSGQQASMYTQYMHNEVTINPAYAGSHGVVSATLLHRNQWTGMEGSPKTTTVNAHMPLTNEAIGIGVSVLNEKIGVTDKTLINAAGAYHLPIGGGKRVSFGLQMGALHQKSNYSEVDTREQGDKTFQQDEVSGLSPNIGGGIYIEKENVWYAGLSVPHLINSKVEGKDGVSVSEEVRHYFFTAGYVFTVNDLVKLKPSTMVKGVPGAPVNIDISGYFIYDDKYWLGLAYRSLESVSLLAMLQINNEFKVGYAYDYSTGDLGNTNSGSHEIVINYRFAFEKSKVISPRYF